MGCCWRRLSDLVLGHLHLGGQLRERGGPPVLQLEAGAGLLEAGQSVAGMDGQADGAAGVGDAAGDGLADPPRGVGRELEPLAPVELLDRVHQPEVALLDEVEQRQARRLVFLGDRHHQAEVRLNEGALGLQAPALLAAQIPAAVIGERAGGGLLEILAGRRPDLNLLREPDLVVLGQQRVLAEPGPPQTHQRSQARCATSPNLTCSTNLDSGASLVADALANVQHRGAPPHPGGSPR